MEGVPKDDDDGFQQFLDTAYAVRASPSLLRMAVGPSSMERSLMLPLPRAQSVAKDGVLPLLQGDPNSADLATSRVKDILEDLLRSARRPALSRQPRLAGCR